MGLTNLNLTDRVKILCVQERTMVNTVLDPDLSILAKGPSNPVPDNTSASTNRFDYQLVNGRIFIRSKTKDAPLQFFQGNVVSGTHCQWQLFDNIGVPYTGIGDEIKSLLSEEECINEIAVASEILVAVSSDNKIYLYKPTEHKRPTQWVDKVGAPDFIMDELHLPMNRKSWGFSCSVQQKPDVRSTEFIESNEINGYSCDGNGVRHDFGFTATIYVLDGVGQKISYWDTGLPPSFSRGFYVPDGVEGLSISAAGSTLFLSAKDTQGKLHFYSRMVDYEISGPCPGLAVDYGEIPVIEQDEGESVFLGSKTRKLPWGKAAWKEHEIDETILTQLTDKICIRLTGKGDEARELRIAACHPEYGWGYYHKKIDQEAWDFEIAPQAKPQSLQPILPSNAIADSYKLSYDGRLYTHQFPYIKKQVLNSEISITLEEFNPFQSDAEPFFLTLRHRDPAPNGTSTRLKFYAVDAWGLHYHKENDEQLVGHVDGEPKALILTLQLTPKQKKLAQEKNPLGSFIKKYFLSFDEKTKAIPMIADNTMAVLKLTHVDFRFQRTISEKEINASFYMQKAMNLALLKQPMNVQECEQLIEANKKCLSEIEAIYSSRIKTDKIFYNINTAISLGHPTISLLFKAYSPEDPTYEQAVIDTNLLFKVHRHATSYSKKMKSPAPGYYQAKTELVERIKNLETYSKNTILPHEPYTRIMNSK